DLTPSSSAVSIDVHTSLSARRQQLSVLEDAVRTARKETTSLISRIEELTEIVDSVMGQAQEEEEMRFTIDGFRASIKSYWRFRVAVAGEIEKCIGLRAETVQLLAKCILASGGGGSTDGGQDVHQRDPLLSSALLTVTLDPPTDAFPDALPGTFPPQQHRPPSPPTDESTTFTSLQKERLASLAP
ncbi:hypothetical protein HK104_008140, partial [Borealophlyctis nickersoniae]